MPFVLITIGIILFVTAINGTIKAFGSQLYKDLFTGSPSFMYWFLAILIVGLIGYIPGAKRPADAFMVLIIIGMVLANGGVFQKLQQAIQQGPSGETSASPLQVVPITGTLAGQTPSMQSVLGQATQYLTPAGSVAASAAGGGIGAM